MKIKFILLLLTSVLFVPLNAQTSIKFDKVYREVNYKRPKTDSLFAFNFEYLDEQQFSVLHDNLLNLLPKPAQVKEYKCFADTEENILFTNEDIRNRLIVGDSVEQSSFDEMGNEYYTAVWTADSSGRINNIQKILFKESWEVDTVNFKFSIDVKGFLPTTYYNMEEIYRELFYVKSGDKSFRKIDISNLVITDVYLKQDPLIQYEYILNGANTEVDKYSTMLMMNSIIKQIKKNKVTCFYPSLPFDKRVSKSHLKTLFTEESISGTKKEPYPVANRLYLYRFKLVEKLSLDPIAMKFHKEVLGMIILKRNEVNDFTVDANSNIVYTFTPIVFVPFNK